MTDHTIDPVLAERWLAKNSQIMLAAGLDTVEQALESNFVVARDDAGEILLREHALHTLAVLAAELKENRELDEHTEDEAKDDWTTLEIEVPVPVLRDAEQIAEQMGVSVKYVMEHMLFRGMMERRLAFTATYKATQAVVGSRIQMVEDELNTPPSNDDEEPVAPEDDTTYTLQYTLSDGSYHTSDPFFLLSEARTSFESWRIRREDVVTMHLVDSYGNEVDSFTRQLEEEAGGEE